jgi:hypothetical protein
MGIIEAYYDLCAPPPTNPMARPSSITVTLAQGHTSDTCITSHHIACDIMGRRANIEKSGEQVPEQKEDKGQNGPGVFQSIPPLPITGLMSCVNLAPCMYACTSSGVKGRMNRQTAHDRNSNGHMAKEHEGDLSWIDGGRGSGRWATAILRIFHMPNHILPLRLFLPPVTILKQGATP